jgi:hypothetical protein
MPSHPEIVIHTIVKPYRAAKSKLSNAQHFWLHRFFATLRLGTLEHGQIMPESKEKHEALLDAFTDIFNDLPPKTRNKLQTYLRLEQIDASETMTQAQFLECMYTEMMEIMALYAYPKYNMLRMVDTSKNKS